MQKSILTDKKGNIGIISLNRPEHLNTFSSDLAINLNIALKEFEKDEDIKVVIVKAEGKAFSTGIDVTEYEGKKFEEYKKWIKVMDEMHFTISNMTKPVIASAHKFAVANGAGLLFACDFAIISEETIIGTTAINLGLICTGPIIPVSYTLSKCKTLEMLLSGEMIDAKEAERLNLVNKVVKKEKLEEETLNFAKKLAKKSSESLKIGKEFYYNMLNMSFKERFEYQSNLFARLCISESAKKGVDEYIKNKKLIYS